MAGEGPRIIMREIFNKSLLAVDPYKAVASYSAAIRSAHKSGNAMTTARQLAIKRGILAGISFGAAMWAATQIARRLGTGKRTVVRLPDKGDRYLSAGLFISESI